MTPIDPYLAHLRPRFGGAGILLQARNTGRYLFLHDPYMGFWNTPGGGIERGETAFVAAMREFTEETGGYETVHVGFEPLVHGPPYWLFHGFTSHEFKPILSHEHDAFVWRSLDNAPEPLHPGLRSLLR